MREDILRADATAKKMVSSEQPITDPLPGCMVFFKLT